MRENARRWKEWPICPHCKQEAPCIDSEAFLMSCSNEECPVLGFKVDAEGQILKVWMRIKDSQDEDLDPSDLDTSIDWTAEMIIKTWDSQNAEYEKINGQNKKNTQRTRRARK
jgi:hypothetical protein